ncbi:MAG: mannose-6-phosphate isomerase, partial [Microcystis sp.]
MDDLTNAPSPSPQEIEMTRTPPWGTVTVLEESPRYRINRIVIKPGHHMSTQMHYHR